MAYRGHLRHTDGEKAIQKIAVPPGKRIVVFPESLILRLEGMGARLADIAAEIALSLIEDDARHLRVKLHRHG